MKVYLKEKKGQNIMEVNNHFVLGKASSSNWPISDAEASDRHFRIEKRGEKYYIKDLQSEKGTYLNGASIIEAVLNDGDEITAGNSCFIFTSQLFAKAKKLKSKNTYYQKTIDKLYDYAKTDYPILITGPSGSGKEVVANTIHESSERSSKNFVAVNCSALNANLIESELFGHTKGSFTGATQDRKGAFEAADNGTLFLDEIGDLPLELQAKLLRALENSEIRPVGSDSTKKINVRVISATHSTLKKKVIEGQFREDLYFRLNVLNIKTLPLTKRLEDFEEILYSFCKQMRVSFSFKAIKKLKTHDWQGNIRELKNVVARASAVYRGLIVSEDQVDDLLDSLPSNFANTDSGKPNLLGYKIKELEKEAITQSLLENHGHQVRVAEALGMPKSTLCDRIKKYRINIKELVYN